MKWKVTHALFFAFLIAVGCAQPVRYVFTLPNDFVGELTVVFHPKGLDRIEHATESGKTVVTIRFPDSGVFVTADRKSLHQLSDDEVWKYRDGRVIRRWFDPLPPGFEFVGRTVGMEIRNVSKDDPLFRWAVPNGDGFEVTTFRFRVTRTK